MPRSGPWARAHIKAETPFGVISSHTPVRVEGLVGKGGVLVKMHCQGTPIEFCLVDQNLIDFIELVVSHMEDGETADDIRDRLDHIIGRAVVA